MPNAVDDYESILNSNRIWLERTKGVGLLSADALLFARAPDTETFEAVSEARALAHSLVDSGRCRMEVAAALLAALRSCGPEGMPASMTSLRGQRFSRHPFWSRVGH